MKKQVLLNKFLLLRATLFFKRTCRKDQQIILTDSQAGLEMNPNKLCKHCKALYERMKR